MAYSFTNEQVSQLLKEVAASLTIKKANRFQIAAYEEAAAAIEHLTSEIKDLYDDQKLDSIPGVGVNLASHLNELFKTGKSNHFNKIKADFTPAMFVLLVLPKIGPKTAYKLTQKLKLKNQNQAIEDLKQACLRNKVSRIPGFGEKSQAEILQAITDYQNRLSQPQRMTLVYADQLADQIINYLKKSTLAIQIDPLGSLRRRVATIGDIDLAASTNYPVKLIDYFLKYPKIKKVVEKGTQGATIILNNQQQIDLRVQNPLKYGAMLQYFTGSKQHNIHLRQLALKKGLSLSEHGIKKIKNAKMQNFKDEESFYHYLGLEYIPPELREDTGEIEAALQNKLPKLVELSDIKGDLHTHSNIPIEESHDPGNDSIEQMAQRAYRLGYQYLGLSEHNPSISQHTEQQFYKLIAFKKSIIDKFNYTRVTKLPIRIFNGLEVDIQPNGQLAIPNNAINLLDYLIVSIHSSFDLSRQQMTKRVLKALSYPKVKIFGHPTGRLLNKREGYELDWPIIFKFCRENNIWLEINAFPDRLDLPDHLVREAVKNKVKIVINTDSHSIDQLSLMKYGVSVAKRGWAEKTNIVNTLSCDRIIKEFERR